VSEYLNEDEQVEALKRWWKENGKAVIGGAVLGLAVVGGWQGWQKYTTAQAERASAYFEQFLQTVRGNDAAAAKQQGERLLGEFGDSTYAVLTALELARVEYQQGEADSAVARLRWAVAHAEDPGLEQLARLRLARLLFDAGDLDAAAQLVKGQVAAAFAGEFAVLRGDIARAQGDTAAARSAYQEALSHGVANQDLLEMKLLEVGGQPAAS
jgi:predicted negative regulator of RcsB-dependent stress response